MNRLLLIGNGFDLAHGMETSYSHFINDFWKQKADDVLNRYIENSKLSMHSTYNMFFYVDDDDFIEIKQTKVLYTFRIPQKTEKNGFLYFLNILTSMNIELGKNLIIKNNFMKHISKDGLNNWVDIEIEYYKIMIKCLQNDNIDGISNLNKEFELIKLALIKYLNIINAKDFIPIDSIKNLIEYIIDDNSINKGLSKHLNYKTLFLNFNYTDTDNYYIKYLKNHTADEVLNIHIHGKLKEQNNQIIFGYDDDKDETFNSLKNKPDTLWLENIKSIRYSNTYNYRKLLSFIKNNEYGVYILGHSCGISDRTILSQILENKNCQSIKIFYHIKENNTDDYNEKVINITRMFTNTILMNEKITPKPDCVPLSDIPKFLPNLI